MNPSPSIRAATPSDIDAIQELLAQLYDGEGADHVRDTQTLRDALFSPSAPTRLHALVAEQNTHIIGTLLYYSGYDVSSARFGFHLADMIVHKRVRRSSIGRRLFSHMVMQCLAQDGAWISLTALPKNAAARHFYKAMGFGKTNIDFYTIGRNGMKIHA